MSERSIKPVPLAFPKPGQKPPPHINRDEYGEERDLPEELELSPEGIGRLKYLLLTIATSIAVPVVGAVFMVILKIKPPPDGQFLSLWGFFVVALVAAMLGVSVYLAYQRLKNVGGNPVVWVVLYFVPLVNLFVFFLLFCAPANFLNGEKLDTAGKVVLVIWIVLSISPFVMLARWGPEIRAAREKILKENVYIDTMIQGKTLTDKKLQREVIKMIASMSPVLYGQEIPLTSTVKSKVLEGPINTPGGGKLWSEMWLFKTPESSIPFVISFRQTDRGNTMFEIGKIETARRTKETARGQAAGQTAGQEEGYTTRETPGSEGTAEGRQDPTPEPRMFQREYSFD